MSIDQKNDLDNDYPIDKINSQENSFDDEIEKFDTDVFVEDNSNKYLVIVQVFNDISNVNKFIENSNDKLDYIFDNNKYYVYAFAGNDRQSAENFRSSYRKECWIRNP